MCMAVLSLWSQGDPGYSLIDTFALPVNMEPIVTLLCSERKWMHHCCQRISYFTGAMGATFLGRVGQEELCSITMLIEC